MKITTDLRIQITVCIQKANYLTQLKINELFLYSELNKLPKPVLNTIVEKYIQESGPINALRLDVAQQLLINNQVDEAFIDASKFEIGNQFEKNVFRAFNKSYSLFYPFFLELNPFDEKSLLNELSSHIINTLGLKGVKTRIVGFNGSMNYGSDWVWFAIYNASHPNHQTAKQLFLSIESSGVFLSLYDRPNNEHLKQLFFLSEEINVTEIVLFYKEFISEIESDMYNNQSVKIVPNIYKLSHGTDVIVDADYAELLERNIAIVHKNIPPMGKNKTSQFEDFKNARIGDLFYLCRSNQNLVLIGKFIDVVKPCEIEHLGKDGWMQRRYSIIKESNPNKGYFGRKKAWWLPSGHSTFYIIYKENYDLANKALFIQHFGISINELIEQQTTSIEEVKTENVSAPFLASYTINDSKVKPVLEIQKITKPFVGLIKKMQSEPGQMLGVFGTWGRGKTYFVRELCKELNIDFDNQNELIPRTKKDTSTQFQFLKFHAWKYQDTEGVWAYLYETIAEKYFKHKNKSHWDDPETSWWNKKRFSLLKWINEKLLLIKLNFVRNGYADLILFLVSCLGFLWIGSKNDFKNPELLGIFSFTTVGAFSGFFAIRLFYKTYKLGDLGKRVVQKYTQRPTFNKLLGIQSEVQSELKHLLKAWIKEPRNGTNSSEENAYSRRLLLFVDDVDRCDHDRLIKVVDALRVMLEDEEIVKRVIVLLAVDQTILQGAIICKYATVINTIKEQEFTVEKDLEKIVREYMDKLFISGIQLPQLYKKEQWSILENYASEYDYVRSPINQKSTDDTNNEGNNQSSKPKIDDLTNRILEEESILEDSANLSEEKLKIHEHELAAIRDQLSDFTFCTPRLIRIIIYRFLLAKKIAQEHGINTVEEYNKMLATYITQKTIKKELSNFADLSISEKENETTNKIIEMVVPY